MAREHAMIEPFEPGQVAKHGRKIVSYGPPATATTCAAQSEFKIFTNIQLTIVTRRISTRRLVDFGGDVCIILQLVRPRPDRGVLPHTAQCHWLYVARMRKYSRSGRGERVGRNDHTSHQVDEALLVEFFGSTIDGVDFGEILNSLAQRTS